MESVKKSTDERAQHKRHYDRRVNKRLMQTQESKVVLGKELDADLAFMESNGTKSDKQDTSSSLRNYITLVVEADIRLNIKVLPKYHNEDGNHGRANIKQSLGRPCSDAVAFACAILSLLLEIKDDDPKCWPTCCRITRRGTSGRAGRGNGRTRGRSGDQGDGRIDGQGGQVGGQDREMNDGDQGIGQGNGRKKMAMPLMTTSRIEKMESIQDMSGCRDSQRLVPHLVTLKGKMSERFIKNTLEKRGNGKEPSKDRNVRDENKRTWIGNAFSITANPVRRKYTGTTPKCTTSNYHHSPETPCHTCFNYNWPRHFAKECRVVPRNLNPINARNPVARTCYECGSTGHIKATCPRLNQAQRPGETLGTKLWLLMGVKVVETKGTRKEVGHSCWKQMRLARTRHHDSESFNMIIRMDWLSNHKAEIICHEKVVRIPLLGGKALGFQNPCYLKRAQKLKPKLYDGSVIEKSDAIVIPDLEETLLLADESRSKMFEKQNDPKMTEKKVITKPIDYAILNQLSTDFKTRTTIVEVPKELPKVSMVNSCLKKLKFHLASFDMQIEQAVEQHCEEKNKFQDKMESVLKDNDRLLQKAIIVDIVNLIVYDNVNSASQSQAKDTVILKLKEKIQSLGGDVNEKKTYKQLYDSIKSSRVRLKDQCVDLINKVSLKSAEVSDLNASLQEKVLVITALKENLSKLKGKAVVTEAVSLNPIDPELLKIDVAPLALKLHKNRTIYIDYLRHTQNETATLREIVESERLLNPLNTSLDYACKIQRTPRKAKKNKLADHLRTVRPSLNKKSVVDTKATSFVTNSISNVNFDLKCDTCNGCLFSDNHDSCVEPTGNVFKTVGHIWKPTGRTFTLVGNVYPLTRIATTTIVPHREPVPIVTNTDKPVVTLVYSRKSKAANTKVPVSNSAINKSLVVQIVLWYLDSGCSNHMTEDRSQLINFIQKFLGTVKFGNDHVARIMGYSDYQIGNLTISRVYCVEGLGHNLFSHRRLSHLNFGAINYLARQGLVRGLSKLKFEKDHLCSACAMGKSMKKTHKPKSEDTNQEKLYLIHMDLCGPMRVESVNGKKYILVIVDDYSRFTWVKFLRSKDETPDFIISFLKMIQVRLKVPVYRIRIDNKTEFVNQRLRDYYKEVDISYETSVARSPQQNGVVERRNRTLIEAARTMLIYAQALLFLWAEAVATACFTQNRSIIRLRHGKTPYELLHSKLPDLSFFHVFGALCYLTNDSENLGKLQPKADIGIFIGYAPIKKAF
uniref:Retrovirus-related Pol polyprotein from transposon TNT 1-94 n=1 Tax=Tanacetum cinerariifolium TaxID=118510 RepID=A0A6L2N052_TANCI|nr:hypothetical protein [Tanacetum cinerariifolium]